MRPAYRMCVRVPLFIGLWLAVATVTVAQTSPLGPYHARFLAGGEGITEAIDAGHPLLADDPHWTIHGWIRSRELQNGPVLLGGFGDPQSTGRYLGLRDGKPMLRVAGQELVAKTGVPAGEWRFLAARYDGENAELLVDGSAVARAKIGPGRATSAR